MFRLTFCGFLITISLIFLSSCQKDFETVPSNGNLSFSRDTIFLDTIFKQTSSSTRSFKVYNKSNDDITIPSIQLGRGEASFYRLNVDGIADKSFQNIDIKANDSIFIFVEMTYTDAISDSYLYKDSIVFDDEDKLQDVDLITLVQDATFLFPQRDAQKVKESITLGTNDNGETIVVDGFLLKDNQLTWTNDKPYVVYGFVGVPEGKTLTIEAGTQVHFHDTQSGILVQKNATLNINGTLDEKVIFEGDRLEPNYADVAGQWGTIWLRQGSKNNRINHAVIKNASIGLLVDDNVNTNPTLTITNSELYNFSNYGVMGRSTNIVGQNLVMANAGQSVLAATMGGTYNFTHCTFANYWSSSFRQLPTVLVNNFFVDENEKVFPFNLNQANFVNCIVEGSQNVEFLVDKVDEGAFNFSVKNSMLKFNTSDTSLTENPLFDFDDTNLYQNIILNGNVDFRNIDTNNLIIGQDSEAINKASSTGASLVPLDILGVSRTTNPDVGAYQHIVFEDK